jgi:hypothetical protein
MATVFESISLKGLRPAHLKQLLSYVEEAEQSVYHYGDYNHYLKRHWELKAWLQRAIEYATAEGVVMPK